MWTRQLLKQNGKVAFLRNYWTCVLVSVIASIFISGSTGITLTYNAGTETSMVTDYSSGDLETLIAQIPRTFLVAFFMMMVVASVLGVVITLLVSHVAEVGRNRYFLENREHKTGIGQLFYNFQGGRYGSTVWIMFLKSLAIFVGYLFFVIPGIILFYSYLMVPYIIAERTDMDRKRIFQLSRKMMKGHKMEAFVLELSFIGWHILGGFSGGLVNVFYVNPYKSATYAEFYSALKAEALQKGILQEGELPGFEIPEVEIPTV